MDKKSENSVEMSREKLREHKSDFFGNNCNTQRVLNSNLTKSIHQLFNSYKKQHDGKGLRFLQVGTDERQNAAI